LSVKTIVLSLSIFVSIPLFIPATVDAGICESVVSLYNRLIKGQHYFSREEISQLDQVLKEWTPSRIDGLNNIGDEYFFFLLRETPDQIVDLFRRAPTKNKEFKAYFFEVGKRLKNNDFQTLFPVLLENFYRKMDGRSIDARTFIADGLENLDKLTLERIAEIRKILFEKFESTLSTRAVRNGFYKKLEVTTIDGKQFIKIGPEIYPYRKDKGRHLIKVPRLEMRHPAWNPINTKNAVAIATARVPPPENYRVAIGLDGKFYIEDGNHRFSIVEFREEIWVELGHGLKTLNVSMFYDYAYGGLMASSEMKRIMAGKLDPLFYVSEARKKLIVFSIDELEKAAPTKYFNPLAD